MFEWLCVGVNKNIHFKTGINNDERFKQGNHLWTQGKRYFDLAVLSCFSKQIRCKI